LKHKSIPPAVIRNQTRGSDAKKLDYLQLHLDNITPVIPTVRERTIFNSSFNTRNKVRIPDLQVTTTNIVIEHDTQHIHGELSDPNKKTLARNADYMRANIPFIIINSDLAKLNNLDEADLTVYLYYHKLMEIKSREELK